MSEKEINIDEIISEIDVEDEDEEIEENQEKSKSVEAPSKKSKLEEKKDNLPDASEEEELMQEVVNMAVEDRKKADDLYNVFVPDVSTGRDRSQASKETMAKAVELKISSAKNIIELLKLKKNDAKNSVGVFFGGETMSGKKAGIDIRNITGEE